MQSFPYRDGELYCEDVPVAKLAEQYGTPLWVYSKSFILGQLKQIQTAFAEVDPVICYSVKANSTLGILKVVRDAGCSFDVVSGGELYRVRADVAGSLGKVGRVALRLNPDIDAKTHAKTTTGKKGNKFGMDIERFRELAAKVLKDKRLALKGIHMHLGSPILTTDPYAAAGQKAIEVVEGLRRDGHDINWINLGGGFGISYRGNEGLPASAYADVIVPAVREAKCRLALEPGRFVVGNSCVLISRVVFSKREGGKLFVIQDGGMNDLIRPAMYDSFHRVWPVKPAVPMPENVEDAIDGCEKTDVVGPVCESSDYFAKDRFLPPMKRGDLFATFSAGAYGTAMSSNYNTRPRGTEILVDGTNVTVIRRRETYADLIAHEITD